jgi:CheY-like chemotaxis protein
MSSHPIRCLVVEDNPNLNRDLVFYLSSHGMEAVGVSDGAGLDRHLAACACDLVVLDLGLPGEDGLDIARRIASRGELGLVILTARGGLEDRLAGWDSGAHVYLVKPVPLAEVAAVVGAVFRRLHPEPPVPARPWRLSAARREVLAPPTGPPLHSPTASACCCRPWPPRRSAASPGTSAWTRRSAGPSTPWCIACGASSRPMVTPSVPSTARAWCSMPSCCARRRNDRAVRSEIYRKHTDFRFRRSDFSPTALAARSGENRKPVRKKYNSPI